MAIGRIKTEADLDRFIQERLEAIPLTAVDGLSGHLAERGRTRAGTEVLSVPEGSTSTEVLKVAHGLGETPAHVDLQVLRPSGAATWASRLISYDETEIEFMVNTGTAVAEEEAVEVLWLVTGGNG